MTKKKRKPRDATMRNVRAAKKARGRLEDKIMKRLIELEVRVEELENKL